MWELINEVREIGGAPIIDLIKTIFAIDPSIDLLSDPDPSYRDVLLDVFRMFFLPLLDGLYKSEVESLAEKIKAAWHLDETQYQSLLIDLRDMSI